VCRCFLIGCSCVFLLARHHCFSSLFYYFQDLIIDAIYADIIHGKLDQKNKQVCYVRGFLNANYMYEKGEYFLKLCACFVYML